MIYFISGHRNITDAEFRTNYIPKLEEAIKNDGEFLVGDYYGVDMISQEYLKGRVSDDKVTVYHMYKSPRYYVDGFKTKGGYYFDESRDAAMTDESHGDIAWSRSVGSGTERNLHRRIENDELKWLRYLQSNISSELKAGVKLMYDSHLTSIKSQVTPSKNLTGKMSFSEFLELKK